MKIKILVLLACYNGEDYIEQQIESIFIQENCTIFSGIELGFVTELIIHIFFKEHGYIQTTRKPKWRKTRASSVYNNQVFME